MRATQGMAIMVLASSVLCWRMTSGAERAVSSMLVVLLSGTDAASITDSDGHQIPKSFRVLASPPGPAHAKRAALLEIPSLAPGTRNAEATRCTRGLCR